MAELPRGVTHPRSAASARGWIWLLVLAAIVLVSSWATVWVMPAPKQCESINCGDNFNPDQVPWRLLSFWNWQQLVVLLVGVALTTVLVVMAARARGRTGRSRTSE